MYMKFDVLFWPIIPPYVVNFIRLNYCLRYIQKVDGTFSLFSKYSSRFTQIELLPNAKMKDSQWMIAVQTYKWLAADLHTSPVFASCC